jgi:hypothetical protein
MKGKTTVNIAGWQLAVLARKASTREIELYEKEI